MMAKLQDGTGNTVNEGLNPEVATTEDGGVSRTAVTPAMWRKLVSQYNLHVLLITEQDGLTLNKARILAWEEGAAGLKARMGRPMAA